MRVLAEQIDVPMYSEPDSKNPVAIAQNAIQEAKEMCIRDSLTTAVVRKEQSCGMHKTQL